MLCYSHGVESASFPSYSKCKKKTALMQIFAKNFNFVKLISLLMLCLTQQTNHVTLWVNNYIFPLNLPNFTHITHQIHSKRFIRKKLL